MIQGRYELLQEQFLSVAFCSDHLRHWPKTPL